MPSYIDTAHQTGIAPIIKLIAFTDGDVDPTDFAGETAALTLELSGVDANLELEEFTQKDAFGKETKWEGSKSGTFSFSILEKTVTALAVASGVDPASANTTVTGYKRVDIDGTLATKYWSAWIYGAFPDGDVFGYVIKKAHFQPQNLVSLKRESAPLQVTLVADPLDSGASIVAYETNP